jgi:hypothetical protein
MLDLYHAAWVMTVVALLWACFGLPFWLVLAAISYFSSRRSRVALAKMRERTGEGDPVVTRYARPAKIVAVIAAGLLGLSGAALGAGTLLPGHGVVPMALFELGGALLWSVPGMTAALATLLVASIFDIRNGRRVAGRDSVLAYAFATGIQATLLVGVLVGAANGVQIL